MQQLWRFYQGHGDNNQSLDELEMQSLVGSNGSQSSAAGRGQPHRHGRVDRAPTPDKAESSKSYRAARKGVMHARAATKVGSVLHMPFCNSTMSENGGSLSDSTLYCLMQSCKSNLLQVHLFLHIHA
jgi:hypothetical protein